MLRQMTLRALAEHIITPEKAESLCPLEFKEQTGVREKAEGLRVTAEEILNLPQAERKKILRYAAEILKDDYEQDSELNAFEAFQDEEQ
jgi:acyl-CoA reductase-like NAD-dependent aldehyde dehydrogenase